MVALTFLHCRSMTWREITTFKTLCWEIGCGSRQYVVLHAMHSQCVIYVQDIISQDPTTHGSMFIPIILGSDKTTVSVARVQNEYCPVYLSIGNIHNNVRCGH